MRYNPGKDPDGVKCVQSVKVIEESKKKAEEFEEPRNRVVVHGMKNSLCLKRQMC